VEFTLEQDMKAEGQYKYSSTLSSTSALEVGRGWSMPHLAALPGNAAEVLHNKSKLPPHNPPNFSFAITLHHRIHIHYQLISLPFRFIPLPTVRHGNPL